MAKETEKNVLDGVEFPIPHKGPISKNQLQVLTVRLIEKKQPLEKLSVESGIKMSRLEEVKAGTYTYGTNTKSTGGGKTSASKKAPEDDRKIYRVPAGAEVLERGHPLIPLKSLYREVEKLERQIAHDESEITRVEGVLKQSKEILASHMDALAAAKARLAKLDELLKDIAAEKATAK
jgi:vacuolar-type H+-ATPase subunit I/STV1